MEGIGAGILENMTLGAMKAVLKDSFEDWRPVVRFPSSFY